MIEQKIFSRMRFDTERMEAYGFARKGTSYILEKDFMDGDFTAVLTVHENGQVRGRVLDNMNDEEYVQLRMPNYTGSYVNTVRAAYEEVLRDVAEKCCREVAFASDQSNRITEVIAERYQVTPDFPWDEGAHAPSGVFRHNNNQKWFGLLMNLDRRLLEPDAAEEDVDVLNLKADESRKDAVLGMTGVYPAYHMNHDKWISVILDDKLEDAVVLGLIEDSYRLTSGSSKTLNEPLIRKVLGIADSIPAGKVASYGQIAGLAGIPKNSRLVGRIMSMQDRYGEHPCHRVVNHAGRTAPGWTEQRQLLEKEGVEFKANGCVDMDRYAITADDAETIQKTMESNR